MVTISRAEGDKQRRRVSVEKVFDDFRLDGLSPSPAALRDAEEYIEGRRTLDEIIGDVVSRHTRIDDGMIR
ncbi:antitoxin VbhA family protein [Microbacterium sp. p3-SID338]|uniref:antitoxin VbhA family protein n=1 Tax=Microbacterium sp. p3-SID338 TaxID=2916214 RepID=UPI0021A4A977|nr:antitoxin VbhA family protein [Microbacterium sp. p3-SID338]MCT1394676.1 antitoxin VbhA family protein [Microbacterium sp. p3-SID338]